MSVRVALGMVAERSTPIYSATLLDENGAAIGSALMTEMKLTLYDEASGAIINSVTAVNVLNNDRGVLTAGGLFTITFQAADTQVLDTAREREVHIALLEYKWAAGARENAHEIEMTVLNLAKRT